MGNGPNLAALRSVMVRWIRWSFLVVLLTAVPVAARAQSEGVGKAKQEKVQAKKERREAKEVRKEEKRIAKKHLSNQDRATRKRMKQHKRRADQHGSNGHRDPFLRRLFGSKH